MESRCVRVLVLSALVLISLLPASSALAGNLWGGVASPFGNSFLLATPPGKATLVSPSGSITTNNPFFQWNAVSDATKYYLWVDDSSGVGRFKVWYSAWDAGCVSGTGICSVSLGAELAAGNASWKVQTANDYGPGSWSDPLNFVVPPPAPPSKSWLTSPSGVLNFTNPTYIWLAMGNTTVYHLWVDDSSGPGKIDAWFTAEQVGCAGGSGDCSILPATQLAAGAASARVQACNDGGCGPWSETLSFSVDPYFHFDEQFEGVTAFNWTPNTCTWTLSEGTFRTAGWSGISSALYSATLKDANFQARLLRNGCLECANYLMIRSSGSFYPEGPPNVYYFEYTADGYFSVWSRVDQIDYPIWPWTKSSVINIGSQWNILRVVASGADLSFYINGTLVWKGKDSDLTVGQVGFGAYTYQDGDEFRADWASLSTPAASSAGDFDGNGVSDLVWRYRGSGLYQGWNSIWYLDAADGSGTWTKQFRMLPTVSDLNWDIAGNADFDGDGVPDILWRYNGTGAYQGWNSIWYMNADGGLKGVKILMPVSDLSWQIAGCWDMDGDGVPDIVWRNYGTGTYQGWDSIWYMNADGSNKSFKILSAVPDTNWRIEGGGDLDGDGVPDLLWRYFGTGAYQGWNSLWYMNADGTIKGSRILTAVPDLNWEMCGTGQFDKDGNLDILWRYYGTGSYQGWNSVWFMNPDGSVKGWQLLDIVPDTGWVLKN